MSSNSDFRIRTTQNERPGRVATSLEKMRLNSPVQFSTEQIVLLDSIGFEIGQLLNGIEKDERKLTISRMENVSLYCKDKKLPEDTYTLIDSIIRGWTYFPNDVIPVVKA